MPGVKTNEIARHPRRAAPLPDVGVQGPPGPRPGAGPGRRSGRGDPERHAPRSRPGGRQGAGLGGGQRPQQRSAGPRRAVRVGLLRRRGHHAQAVASEGPGSCYPDPQAHVPHHRHREPAARRQARASPCPPGHRERRAAVAPGGRIAAWRRGTGTAPSRACTRPRPRPAVDELETTSADVVEDEGAVAETRTGATSEPPWPMVRRPTSKSRRGSTTRSPKAPTPTPTQTATADIETDADTDTEAAPEEEAPAAKPRRAA